MRSMGSIELRRLAVASWLIVALSVGVLALLLAARLLPFPENFFIEGSAIIEFEDGSPGHVFLSADDKWRIEARLDEIDARYLDALIRFEDKRFWSHPGVDLFAVIRAAITNAWRGRIVSGGSTLTMQLARVREQRPRTLRSKAIEAFRALQLEARFSKEEILSLYLTYVPFGRNLEGVEAAALAYFGHPASALSSAEIAILLAVPQTPQRRYPSEANRGRLKSARDAIAERLLAWGALPSTGGKDEALRQVRERPVPASLLPFPRLAPHAAAWLRARYPGHRRIRSTLDRGIQLVAERTLRGAADEIARRGIHNGSIVVIEHGTTEVRALVGGFDFWDEAHGGQIAGFDTPRSPGSALKPFIYAMGIDRGLLLPDHLVLDVPRTYGTYAPKNYDGRFSGLIRFEDALSRSLNLPFVDLLRRLGIERFIGTLRTMGVESLRREPGFYGLSAAIGGLEMTPLELAGIYSTLAQNGEYRPLRWMRTHDRDAEAAGEGALAVFSPGAAHLTKGALRLKDRPDFPARRRFSGRHPNIHWKTGTSFGHRDAWAAGSGARYTAVVWLGNLDNTPSVSLVGADGAAPILFDLLEALEAKGSDLRLEPPPADLKVIEVCAYSGRLPGPACEHTRRVRALTRRIPTGTCPYHVAVDVDVKSGLALTPTCRGAHEYRSENFLVWPSSLRRWLDDEHRHVPQPPARSPDCEVVASKSAPAILSPPANHVALLIPGLAPDKQEIPLAAESAAGGRDLSWFVDGEYLGTVRAEERIWWVPRPGAHEIVVADDTGRSARRRFEVRSGR